MKKILTVAAIAAVALVFASSATANALTCTHSSTCSGNLGSGKGGGSVSGGTLPFTGLDLAGIAGVGALLLGTGVVLRRAGRKAQPDSADVS